MTEPGWLHDHECLFCGLTVTCTNPACTEGDLCPKCAAENEERESEA